MTRVKRQVHQEPWMVALDKAAHEAFLRSLRRHVLVDCHQAAQLAAECRVPASIVRGVQ